MTRDPNGHRRLILAPSLLLLAAWIVLAVVSRSFLWLIPAAMMLGWLASSLVRLDVRTAIEPVHSVYQRLFDEAPVAQHELDREGRIRRVNRAECEILGHSAEEMIGRPVWEFVSPHERERSRIATLGKLSGVDPLVPLTRRYLHADGTERVLEIHEKLLRNLAGHITGIHTTLLDITQRVRQQERTQALLSALPDRVFLLGRDGTVQEQHVPGSPQSANERSGEAITEVLGQEAGNKVLSAIAQAAGTSRQSTFACELNSDLQEETKQYEGRMVRSESGQFVCVLQDVTERRRAESALQASEDMYRSLVSSMAEGMLLFDRDFHVVTHNRAAERIFALRQGQGFDLFSNGVEVIREDGSILPHFEYPVVATMRTGKPCLGQVLGLRLPGQQDPVLWVSLNVEPMFREEERVPYAGLVTVSDITARRQAELERRRSEDQYRELFENQGEAVCLFDAEDRISCANPAAWDLFGIPPEKVVGRSFYDFLDEQARAVVSAQMTHRRLGERGTYELPIRRPDGSRLTVLITATPKFDDHGVFSGSLAILRDVSEQKAAERAAERSAQRTAFLLELHDRAPAMTTVEEIYGYALQQAVRLTESEAGFLFRFRPGEPPLKFHFPPREGDHDDATVVLNPPESGTVRQLTVPLVEGERVLMVLGVRGKASEYDPEDVMQLRVVANDLEKIVARRSAEETLRKLSRAVDQSPVSIVITDVQGSIEYVNPKFCEVTGYTLAEVLGGNPRVLKSGQMPRDMYADLWQTIKSGRVWQGEFHNKRKDGALFWEFASISPVRDSSGVITHFVAVKEDITERKQAEQELRRAREAADAAARAKSEFLALMSHEIRTPMNGILGMSTLLAETPLNHEQMEYAGAIRSCADSLLTILNDILDLSKVEAGKLTLEEVSFDLLSGLEDILELMAFKAHEKGLELLLWHEPGCDRQIIGDPGRIRQVVLNLVSNAIKFTQSGHVSIRSSCQEVDSEHGILRIDVEDTGIGIEADKIPLLFEKFTQLAACNTRRVGGTGLGLAITKQLVGLMQGTIQVDSIVGKGTTFHCVLPVRLGEARSIPSPAGGVAGARVLVADTSRAGADFCAHLCRSWGMLATVATDPADAIAHLTSAESGHRPFHLLVASSRMASVIRSSGELSGAIADTPTLILRMSVEPEPPRAGRNPALQSSLAKPIKSGRLRAAVESLLAGSPGRTSHALAALGHRLGNLEPVAAFENCHVLLAEDNIVNQKLGLALLRRMGCRVTVASDGREALDLAQEQSFDLILMDCHMPEVDGYQATEELRRSERHRRTPIVALTAAALPEDRMRCFASGMDDYLSKPVRPESLRRTIEKWISQPLTQPLP